MTSQRHALSPNCLMNSLCWPRRPVCAFFGVLLLLFPSLSPAAPLRRAVHPAHRAALPTALRAPHAALTQRYAVYMLGSRVGTSDVTQTPTTFEGKQALRVDAKTEMKVVALGTIEQKIDLRQYLDLAGRPLSLSMAMTSGGHTTKVDAHFTDREVACVVESGGTKSDKSVPIPSGVSLVADPDQIGPKGAGKALKPGAKLRLHMFEPMTLQILPIDLEVLPAETITIGGKSYHATVVKSSTPLTGESKSWLDEAGELIQQESLLGVKVVRESITAPAPARTAYVPPPDFAVATSIRTRTVITDPRAVTFLRLRVRGIPDEALVLTDARQSAEIAHDAGKLVVTYSLRAATEGVSGPTPPITSSPSAPRPSSLAAAPYLEVDDPRIRRQAQEIVGDAADPLEKARRVRAWVHEHMKPQLDIGVIRSATDVLQHPVGVCRDYAVLFTALARAAGVPARVCGGILYFKNGFYYHAWAEVQSAPGAAWVPFDATLPTDFVDATHIKFAQGDPTAMFQAVRVIGQLQAVVLEYR